jgi:hypothetical protein
MVFPVDPGNLPSKLLIQIDQEIKRFFDVIGIKLEGLEPFNILQTPAGG